MSIICPTCHSVYVDGTLFCDQCGNWLIGVASSPDEPQVGAKSAVSAQPPWNQASANTVGAAANANTESTDEVPWLQPVPWGGVMDMSEIPPTLPLSGEAPPRKSGVSGPPVRLRALILNTGRLTDWIDDQVIQIGRTDRSVNVFPQIDLEVDGGHNAGVSRRHVRINRQPEGYFVEDLGSINGTFLNRRRLSPGGSAELRDGDELRIGNIVLRVQLAGIPKPGEG